MRSLSPEETELWAKVAATIRPLSREKPDLKGVAAAAEPAPVTKPRPRPAAAPKIAAPPSRPVPGTTLDGSWDRRLATGAVEPDRIVDLHGMSLDRAWHAIDRALEEAIGRGSRLVLLITGHHRPGEPPIKRGAIRAAVHDWLAASRHAGDIAAVRGAHRRHGGGGSLYIVLRRQSRAR
ncbi:MAG TPA: Smr/MutS family protein [Sphingomicrobium sp.]